MGLQARHALNRIQRQLEAVDVVEHAHIEGSRCGAFLLVSAHVNVVVIMPPVSEPVNQPRIAVERKHNRHVAGGKI